MARRATWILGAALLAVVIWGALHFSDERAFVHLAERAEPWWLTVAALLQAGTYVAQGWIWRRVVAASHSFLSRLTAFQLSLAKLFADQALPSAGLSSSILVAKALEQRGLPPAAVKASVLLNVASYHLAYVAALVAALIIVAAHGHANAVIVTAAVLFLLFSGTVSTVVLAVPGHPDAHLAPSLARLPGLASAFNYMTGADAALVRDPRVVLETIALQSAIFLLDAATVWTLIRALGESADPGGVFAGFMVASLFRTMGIVPGGLGTFEASSVLMLRMAGVDLAVALSATLLFRGLSFWLPMLPGYWYSRRLVAPTETGSAATDGVAVQYWAADADDLLRGLGSSDDGLTSAEAARRLQRYGPNAVRERRPLSRLDLLGRQLRSPLLLLLVFAAAASIATAEWLDAAIVLAIVLVSAGIGYSREYSAQAVAAALRARIRTRATVLRDGRAQQVPLEGIVPGDVVLLSAGSLVPADARILQATDFFVSQSVLTGESFPTQKVPGQAAAAAELVQRTNCVFLGTNVRSGSARCLVAATGAATAFGAVAHRLTLRPPETEFDRGVRHFGYLLTTAMLVMVLVVFVVHTIAGRPPIETLLFAVALAVGLSPELLPAILSVNLARGARLMARHGVLVRRLNAIENLGSMDVLCTDKTGTLTEGVVQLEGAYDAGGTRSDAVLDLAACNAALETGVASPLDDAIIAARPPLLGDVRKVAEIPFDFVRKRVTVIVADQGGVRLITKGAFHRVLEACMYAGDGSVMTDGTRAALERQYETWASRGIRVLAVATRRIDERPAYTRDDERELTFAGYLTFLDRPKAGVAGAIGDLAALGVSIKVISGDSAAVTRYIASMVGLRADRVLTGTQLDELHDEALWHAAEQTDAFVEVDPNQKERIILALKKTGHVVGFLGDGVNDAPAMHAADTSLAVEEAVDVAREAADFVLLERGLDVIRRGIEEGRRTFANTLKYVLITTSANLGNMATMAVASLALPFLPLTAGQILLNNFVSDVPALGIAGDRVDRDLIDRPRRWDMRFVGRYMAEFGALSSAFDFLTFAVLLFVFRASPELFRTSWFVESLLTELVVALVIRTRGPFYRSRPGTLLLVLTLLLVALALLMPVLPYAGVIGFVPLPPSLLASVAVITVLYMAATELQKRWFYRRAA